MKKILLLVLPVFLAGCVTTKPFKPVTPSEMTEIQAIKSWNLHGKLGIQYQDKGANANLDWRQENENFFVKLSGPLGQGGLEIFGNEKKVTLIDQSGKRVELASLDAFFKKNFGWELPIQCLMYWIKGLEAPDDHSTATYYPNGKLKTLVQHEWHIEYQEYVMTSRGHLPKRLVLTHPGTRLKVIIKQWEL